MHGKYQAGTDRMCGKRGHNLGREETPETVVEGNVILLCTSVWEFQCVLLPKMVTIPAGTVGS